MKILFVGNSYTFYNDMPAMFEKLANANGHDVSVFSVTKGGRKLIAYKDNEDPVTQKLDDLLKGHHFDVCFIQEQSVLPAMNAGLFLEGVDVVVSKVADRADKLVMYATWGRKEGSKTLAEHGFTRERMTELLSASYQVAAERYHAFLSPVGRNFLDVNQKDPDINLHNEDLSHPSYLGSCLAALTHFYTLYGEFPKNTSSLQLSPEVLNLFRDVVCK